MLTSPFKQELLACLLGICIGGASTYLLLPQKEWADDHYGAASEKYHIHADFLIQTFDTVHNLGTAELMTTAEQSHHEHAHMHDEEGDVLHMHAEGVSFVEFLASLDYVIEDQNLTLPNGDELRSDVMQPEYLQLYVNGELWEDEMDTYIPQDLDRVLLFYGDPNNRPIETYLQSVPNDSCIYSGSCPERGTAPAENCGLTCDL